MKTSEFIESLNFQELGYSVIADGIHVNINGVIIAKVLIHDYAFRINLLGVSLKDMDFDERYNLGKLVIEYATTPLEERGGLPT
ncbi:hypothetical protein ACVQ8P_08025 [Dellaglioa sp. BT-FLS60]